MNDIIDFKLFSVKEFFIQMESYKEQIKNCMKNQAALVKGGDGVGS